MSLAISRHILSVFAPSPRPRVPWGRELVFNLAFELVAMAMGDGSDLMLGRCWAVPSEWASSSPTVAVHFVRCLTLCLPKYPSIVCRYHVSVVSLTPETAKSRALWENLIPYRSAVTYCTVFSVQWRSKKKPRLSADARPVSLSFIHLQRQS